MINTRRGFLGLLLATALVACGSPATLGAAPATPASTPAPPVSAFPRSVTDFQGRTTAIASRPERIVSVGASNTEFLFALGAGDRVVGVDDFSDFPPEAARKEKVGGVKVNVEKVVGLRPDLVVMVKISDGTVERLAGAGIAVVIVDPQSLAEVFRTAVLLGTVIGADGQRLASDLERRVDAVRERTRSAPRPRVFHEVDASDPARPFTVGPGSYLSEIIDVAGGINVAARASSPYPQLSLEEVVRADPEVIVLADADYGVKPDQVAARPGWSALTAVRTGRVFPIADSLVSRPGPRVGEAAEAYARLLHPELFR